MFQPQTLTSHQARVISLAGKYLGPLRTEIVRKALCG